MLALLVASYFEDITRLHHFPFTAAGEAAAAAVRLHVCDITVSDIVSAGII